jgi:tetratricopeptide (TPR) repeat protein
MSFPLFQAFFAFQCGMAYHKSSRLQQRTPVTLSFEKAEKARQASRFKEAQKIYEKWLHRPSLPCEEKAEALLGLADVERIQGDFVQALGHYRKAADLFKDHPGETFWDARVGWALAARACGHPKEALEILKKALRIYRKERDRTGEAFAHWALGGTLRIAGDMKGGLKELQRSLSMFKSLKDSEGVSYTCCALGGLFRMLGKYAESGKFYREANHRMRRRKDSFGIAYSYCGLGNVERMAGRFQAALPFYLKAEKLYGTIGDRVSYAYTLWSLGTTYKMLGQYTQAHRAFYKADNLFKKTGDTRGQIYSLLGFAELEWLKTINPRYPLPLRERARVRGWVVWKKAKAIAVKSDFAWERLHVEALKGGRVNDLASRYRKAGSRFFPTSLPVNWP